MSWLAARWKRYWERCENFKEFEQTGAYDVRRLADGSIFSASKLRDARDWLHKRDTRYQRWAFCASVVAIVISAGAAIVSYKSWDNAHRADRAWVGATTMRLGEKPAVGRDLRFYLEFQNTGRQPARDVFYEPDSYAYRKDMTGDVAERARRHIARCMARQPRDEQMTIFPGRGTFAPYQIKKDSNLITEPVIAGADLILVDGCFVYRTVDEVHRTAFCFEYDASNPQVDDDGKPIMNVCLHGNYAD
ncbi:hypothetical protein ACFQX9_23455 [Bradyrhizobium sp. GCM10028915]|uniref:hypothetical protein n=1 Tax=Bradyrhizobium sp. GCM10028915 TaxID=3273385 RepID=UPI00360D64A2